MLCSSDCNYQYDILPKLATLFIFFIQGMQLTDEFAKSFVERDEN